MSKKIDIIALWIPIFLAATVPIYLYFFFYKDLRKTHITGLKIQPTFQIYSLSNYLKTQNNKNNLIVLSTIWKKNRKTTNIGKAYKLSGTLAIGNEKICIINGEIFLEGAKLNNNLKILKIENNYILLKTKNKILRIKVGDEFYA